MTWRSRLLGYGERVRIPVLLIGAGIVLAGCSSSAAVPATTVPSPASSSASAMPSASPTPVAVSPLTGLPQVQAKPVLVVKLDNTHNAQPHVGLSQADVVYVEEVEYGITRIAAVFSSTLPKTIGPVRSARITDIDLLAQYGSPAFAYSGAQHKMFPVLDSASMVDVSPRKGDINAFHRDSGRRAPYNYFLNPEKALAAAAMPSVARDIGFTFSDQAPAGGAPNEKAKLTQGYSKERFVYDTASGNYLVSLNGYPAMAEETGAQQQAATVVIQYVKQEASKFFDKGGGNTPHADTIGSGTALVLRDGMAYEVTWSRPDALSGTTFTLPDGSPMPFKPGQQWVILQNREHPATVTPALPAASSSASPSSSASYALS